MVRNYIPYVCILQVGLLIQCLSMAQVSNELSLLASSPFRMILQPTAVALSSEALFYIENAVPSLLLAQQNENETFTFSDMEMVIQQVDFLEPRNSTRLRFFMLATTSADAISDAESLQSELNELITSTFEATDVAIYLQASGIPSLQDIQTVAVQEIVPSSPVPPPQDNSGSNTKKLSTIDIVLIVVSGAIFVGIAYMIVQHVKDRGYFENQRLIAMNAAAAVSPNHGADNAQEVNVEGTQLERKQSADHENSNTPSTPSTVNSVTDVEPNEVADAPSTPERRPIRITTVSVGTDAKIIATDSFKEGDDSGIQEKFEKNCFLEERPKAGAKNIKDMNPTETASSESDNSDDVFLIDIEALGADDLKSKSSTQSSAIFEWMKTIRVIPTNASTKQVNQTQSTHGYDDHSPQSESSEPSMDHSSIALSSLEFGSLAGSLESSFVGESVLEVGHLEI